MTGEIRALEMFASLPASCIAHPVTDDRTEPHLRPGEFAVIDKNDREPVLGELYLAQWSNGRREIVQVRRWALTQHRSNFFSVGACRLNGDGYVRAVDGPYSAEHLREKLVGRVAGIYSPNQLTAV